MSELLDAIVANDDTAACRLVEDGADATACGDDGTPALLMALYRGLASTVPAIRRARGGDDDLTLAEAAAVGAVAAVGARLAAGSPVDERSPDGFTPLQLAAFFDHAGAAALLVRAGADVTARAQGRMDIQPLHAAAASPTGSCLPLLVAAGAPLDEEQAGGFTALDELVQRGDAGAAHAALLLAAGASARTGS